MPLHASCYPQNHLQLSVLTCAQEVVWRHKHLALLRSDLDNAMDHDKQPLVMLEAVDNLGTLVHLQAPMLQEHLHGKGAIKAWVMSARPQHV